MRNRESALVRNSNVPIVRDKVLEHIKYMGRDLMLSVAKYGSLACVIADASDGRLGVTTVIAVPLAGFLGTVQHYLRRTTSPDNP